MASLALTAAILTPVSQSSLLSPYKPSLVRPVRPSLSASFPPTSRLVAAAAGEKLSDDVKLDVEIGGGEGGGGGEGRFGGRGGGGDGNSGGGEEEGGEEKKKMGGMSLSQKLTLGYAALVGVGGVIGYVKSGSQKSLAAGGISSLLLYFVYTKLPTKPVFAASLGLGVSAALLAVMGSRFKNSGKVFPAGVVSLVSLVMLAGYSHGILRSMHG